MGHVGATALPWTFTPTGQASDETVLLRALSAISAAASIARRRESARYGSLHLPWPPSGSQPQPGAAYSSISAEVR